MTHELIIDGHHVDLAGAPITLQWTTGLFQNVGNITLSHSYTIQLPKTAHNLRIFDDPSNGGHQSTKIRRYLPAEYIRNGVSVIGDAKAYVLGVTSEAIEIGLLWNLAEGLLNWKEAGKSLSDLNLPTVTWLGSDGIPNYYDTRKEYTFAQYNSGLRSHKYPDVLAGTHPVVQFDYLVRRILSEAGVPFRIDTEALTTAYLLAHRSIPSRAMDLSSGFSASYAAPATNGTTLTFSSVTAGWDSPAATDASGTRITPGETDTHYVRLRMRNMSPEVSLLHNAIVFLGYVWNAGIGRYDVEVFERVPFTLDGSDKEVCGADLVLSGVDRYEYYELAYDAPPRPGYGRLEPYDGSVCVRIGRAHSQLRPDKQNQFPIAACLPDMKQVDFVKGALAFLGLVAYIRKGELIVAPSDAMLDVADALDWTDKVTGVTRVTPAYDKLAQKNVIKFAADDWLPQSPDAVIVTEDNTLPVSADLYSLPFAASRGNNAHHYSVEVTEDAETGAMTYEAAAEDIKPRVFGLRETSGGKKFLVYPGEFQGRGLIDAHYARMAAALRRPLMVEAVVRLSDVDLAALDFTRPVYLTQTGQYYSVLSVQDEGDGISKTTLMQI